ncbi:MAG: hypothetical protein HYX75_03245 [Acidobacteria bacterium]|nr:hypothetical protein [Acidobacteriota bacterium]
MNRNPLLRFWFSVLFWSYGRGTWQYDVLCGAIIAFLLLAPTHAFFSGIEKDPGRPEQKVVGLQKINSNLYLLVVLDRSAPQVMKELDRRWEDFDKQTGHRFTKRAFYDEDDRTMGYILSSP